MTTALELEPVAIRFLGRNYSAEKLGETGIKVGSPNHFNLVNDEVAAQRWLGDHGLKKSKANKLLSAALRNEGDYADPAHPARVKPPNPYGKP